MLAIEPCAECATPAACEAAAGYEPGYEPAPRYKMIYYDPAMRKLSVWLLSAGMLCAQVDFSALKELKYRNIGHFAAGAPWP
jgi:hypothetical protein